MSTIASASITISPFEERFGEEVINFIVNIQQNEFSIPITAKDQPDLADIPDFYQKGYGNFWVAVCSGRIIGTIALLDIGDRMAALRKMFVDPKFRGNKTGTASKLLQTLLSWSKERGLKDIYLGTTPKFLAAHRFYEKNGFDQIQQACLPDAFPVMKVDTKFYKYHL